MKTVEAYLRYSDHNQDGGYSIAYQETEIKEFCIRNGLELHKMHIDEAQTATKVAGREAFFRMIDRVKDGTIGVIVVYKLSRLFRNALESQQYRELFRKKGVKLMSVTQHIDEDTSAGRLMTNVLSNIDQYSSETTSDHVKASMREMARQGYYTGGPVQFGYELYPVSTENGKTRKKYKVYEPEAKIVRLMFEFYGNGKSLTYIQDHFREHGYMKRNGDEFTQQEISRQLDKEMFIGTRIFKTEGYDPLVIPNCFPSIVDIQTWEKVRARKEASKHGRNNKPKPRHNRRNPNPLTGLMICGECGEHYVGYSSGASKRRPSDIKRYYYSCRNKLRKRGCTVKNIPKAKAETAIIDTIRENILNGDIIPDIARRVVAMCDDIPKDIDEKIKSHKRKQKDIEEQLQELVLMKLAKQINEETLAKTGAMLEREMMIAKNTAAALIERKRAIVTVESVEAFLREKAFQFETATPEVLREVFETFIEKVVVYKDKYSVHLRVYPLANAAAYNDTQGPPYVSLFAAKKR